jgi:hypothetical protein
MSRWGLTYKGIEPVPPEDWNSMIDALNDLDERTPLELKGGLASFNGDGTTKDFTITHGLTTTPTIVLIGAGSADASGDKWWEATETQIIVHFITAPPAGSGNVKIWYYAIRL